MISKGFAGHIKTFAFKIIAYKGFDQARTRYIFLKHRVQPIKFLLHGEEERFRPANKKDQNHGSNQQQWHHGQRQTLTSREHQNQAADHHQRGAGADAQGNLQHPLKGAGVAAHSHHQLTGAHAIQITIGEALDLEEKRVAQIARHTFPDLNRGVVIANRDEGDQHRDADHDQAGLDHHLLILLPNPLVNNALNQAGNREIKKDLGRQQNHSDGRTPPIGFDKIE